jgi:hypothetical protein
MDCFIKKIFEEKEKNDSLVHVQFQKFSRGKFDNRALIRVKNTGGVCSISTTSEYSRELVRSLAEKLGDRKTLVIGAIISALDLQGLFQYEEKKMVMGVKKYIINREMSGKELIHICDNVLKAFIGLSFNVGEDELKIKDKSPKSMKGVSSSKSEDDEIKVDFCKLKTSDEKIVKSLLFDSEIENGSFKKVEINHDFIITDIIIPKGETDPAKMRENALRKGKIIRKIKVDDKIISKEKDFVA